MIQVLQRTLCVLLGLVLGAYIFYYDFMSYHGKEDATQRAMRACYKNPECVRTVEAYFNRLLTPCPSILPQ